RGPHDLVEALHRRERQAACEPENPQVDRRVQADEESEPDGVHEEDRRVRPQRARFTDPGGQRTVFDRREKRHVTPPASKGRAYLQTKRAASSVLPLPEWTATCGYGQSGRVRSILPLVTRDATMRSGA